ncbi:NUDIX hydrolase [Roseibium sp. MMSF_3412]|uniref:NUDIX hydrolase n=1 Tax=Roseibium sp. MMSF_3412 TaxID=3046712 RepID=UPI00273D8FAD|nr:NUDIX hydrolase [Roseibium sp. MMSF_3412]
MSTVAELVIPQTAALPLRWNSGKPRVLLITSRETRRWVIPKGWLMKGKTPWETARIEACEEAGALGKIRAKPIGSYHYVKLLPRGESCRCKVLVFPLVVEKLKKNWKERDQRSRQWFPAKKAAKLVSEPELSTLLLNLADSQGANLIPKKLRHIS